MALHHELSFWLAVALVGFLGVVLMKLLAAKIPFAPLQALAAAA